MIHKGIFNWSYKDNDHVVQWNVCWYRCKYLLNLLLNQLILMSFLLFEMTDTLAYISMMVSLWMLSYLCKIINKLYAYVSYLFTYLFIPSCTTLLSTLCTTISLQLFDLSAHPLLVYSFLRLVYFSAPTLVIFWYYMRTAFYLFCYSLLVYFLFIAILSQYVIIFYDFQYSITIIISLYLIVICFNYFSIGGLFLFINGSIVPRFFYFLLRIYILIRSNPIIPNSFNFYFTENSSKPHLSNHLNVIGFTIN